jgi:hypothetical protein
VKVLVQYARAKPIDWEQLDSSAWSSLPKKSSPLSSNSKAHDNSPGHLHAVNVQGVIFSGYDHYAVEHLAEGCRITAWADESKPDGEKHALVWTMFPLAPDNRLGGCINTRQSQVIYAAPDVLARYKSYGPIENTVLRTWDEFTPPAEDLTRHDARLPVEDSDAHHAVLTHRGYEDWTEGLDPSELDPETGKLKGQREQGRYLPLGSTMTWFGSSTTAASAAVAADKELAMLASVSSPTTSSSSNYAGGVSRLAFLFTSPTAGTGFSQWPTGIYRGQLSVSAAGAGMTYGMGTTGSVAGYLGRYDTTLGTALETKAQGEALFTGTGTKLGTTGSVSWTAGSATDVYAVLVGGTRAASTSNQTFTLNINGANTFGDGPWGSISLSPAGMTLTAAKGTTTTAGQANNTVTGFALAAAKGTPTETATASLSVYGISL